MTAIVSTDTYPNVRRVGEYAWKMPVSAGLTSASTLIVVVPAVIGFDFICGFDFVPNTNAFDASPVWSFFDGYILPSTPAVYSRICLLPAFDAESIRLARVFKFRLIATLAVSPLLELETQLNISWSPAASTWSSESLHSHTNALGLYFVEYEFEMDKPAYFTTPASVLTGLMQIVFSLTIPGGTASVSACSVELLSYR